MCIFGDKDDLLTLEQAAMWASDYLQKDVSKNNISYLINYGKILKCDDNRIDKKELKEYYDKHILTKKDSWQNKLGEDLDWHLSFDNLQEKDTTKHVHRLHPYKGKFIPQLVEYFLNDKVDEFKKEIYFKQGDTILDPFMGSGTTLVQASEMGMNSIGIDISSFNCSIAEAKIENYNYDHLEKVLSDSVEQTKKYSKTHFSDQFDKQLSNLISDFNKEYFPSPEYKVKVHRKQIDPASYSKEKLESFQSLYEKIKHNYLPIEDENTEEFSFMSKWYTTRIRQELNFYLNLINKVEDESIKNVMRVILSRTARSCRATTHSDLATLVEPVYEPYYCTKHYKICMPISTIVTKLGTYTKDTLKRIDEFSKIRKNVHSEVIHADSRTVDIFREIKNKNPSFAENLSKNKIDGIFSSPPYVGQIDYHEQHAYAYELFDIERRDEKEIGPLSKGKTKKSKSEYVDGISSVLLNAIPFLKDDANIFIVANDKFDLYPIIAETAKLKIINEYKRPVLNRTERDKQPYSEKIFHMKILPP